MRLHGFWRSSATYRVRVALHWKGLAVDEHIVDLDTGMQRGADHLARNPMGGIPVLELDGGAAPLTQSLAILEFLEEYRPDPPLLPRDPLDRAWVRSLALMLACDTHPLITPRVGSHLRTTGGMAADAWRQWQIHWFHAGLLAFEQQLARSRRSGRFCLGDDPGLADICLASIAAVMQVLHIELPEAPSVRRIVDNCRLLDAFARADPFVQAGAPETT